MDRYDKDKDGCLSMDEYLGNGDPVLLVFLADFAIHARQACM